LDPKRTKTNKTYITIQDHDGADTTQDVAEVAKYLPKTTPLTDCFGDETQQKQSSTAIKTFPQSQLASVMAMKQ
jgi:hypothetical protein